MPTSNAMGYIQETTTYKLENYENSQKSTIHLNHTLKYQYIILNSDFCCIRFKFKQTVNMKYYITVRNCAVSKLNSYVYSLCLRLGS